MLAISEAHPSPSAGAPELSAYWPQIRRLWKRAPFGAFATLDADGAPQITPIGSIYLHPTEPRGFYHPIFTSRLPKALAHDQRFELLFVDPSAGSWLKGLISGGFDHFIAARLKGRASAPRRHATPEEAAHFRRRIRPVSWTRGYDLLWKDLRFVQELTFDSLVPVRFGAMRNGLRG
jgi:hypothetical protein